MKKLCLLLILMGSLFIHIGVLADDAEACCAENMPLAIKTTAKSRSGNPPEIPAGALSVIDTQDVKFTSGEKCDVYSGPGEDYIRAANGKASVSTDDWIQVFGRENGWILIQYAINKEHMRFGWISEKALSESTEIKELNFSPHRSTLLNTTVVTDDPLFSQSAVATLPQGTIVYHLTTMGDWAYIESFSGDLVRGFVNCNLIHAGSVYDLEYCPSMYGTYVLNGTVMIDGNNFEAEIAPILYLNNQEIVVSGFEIYDNIAGDLLLTMNVPNASGQFVGNGTLMASTTSLRIVSICSDNKDVREETVILEW